MRRFTPILILATIVQIPALAADPPADGIDAREATRCGFYFNMLKSSATGRQAQSYELASGLFLQNAMASTSKDQMLQWIDEYQKEFPDRSHGFDEFSKFLGAQQKKCSALLLQLTQAGRATPAKATDAGNKITTRHASNRPSQSTVFGETVNFSDSEGASCEAAILETGVTRREARIRAQYMWLDDQHPAWKVVSQTTRYNKPLKEEKDLEGLLIYSEFAMTDEKSGPQTVCFDATESMKPELISLVKK